jgi:hypothetical protein
MRRLYRTFPGANGRTINATIMDRGDERIIEGHGSGPLDGFVDALRRAGIADIAVGRLSRAHARCGFRLRKQRPMSKPGYRMAERFLALG